MALALQPQAVTAALNEYLQQPGAQAQDLFYLGTTVLAAVPHDPEVGRRVQHLMPYLREFMESDDPNESEEILERCWDEQGHDMAIGFLRMMQQFTNLGNAIHPEARIAFVNTFSRIVEANDYEAAARATAEAANE